jgi:uncharacterized protein involved in outer membrane biogenesis
MSTNKERAKSALKCVGISFLLLIALVLIAAAILQWNADALRRPLSRIVSAHLGRRVGIDGKLELHLLALKPFVVANDVRIGNPPWAGQTDMAQIGHLEIALDLLRFLRAQLVISRIDVGALQLSLLRDSGDHANWRFDNPANRPSASTAAPRLPLVQSFNLDGGHIEIVDSVRKLQFAGAVMASDNAAGSPRLLRLEGKGQLNGAPFELTSHGDGLMTAELQKPYNFSADLRAAGTHLQVQAQIVRPFDLGSLTAAFTVSGQDLADVYYLTGLTLPNTPPYNLSGQLQVQGMQISLGRLAGTLGNSDLHGTMQIQMGTRPKMSADLASRSLDMADLAPAFGAEPRNRVAQEPGLERAREIRPKNNAERARSTDTPVREMQTKEALLLPDAKLDLNRIRGMDADVRYQAQTIKEQKIPFREVSWHLQLNHGVLAINPLSFILPQGKVAGRLRIDARRDVPEDEVDLSLSHVDLAEFHPKDGPPPLNGSLLARVAVHGRGRSVHEVAATADGAMTIVVPHGEIRSALAELTGINVARGLGLLLTKNQQQSEVRCAVADFKSRQGVLTAQNIVMDTQNVRITGKGDINLRNETLNLQINGQPKRLRLVAIRSPIVVHGTLRKPSIGLEAGHLAKQGAEAAVLGALATPLAAILAFVDPGLAKDADCGALLQEAQQSDVPTAPTARAQSPPIGAR